MEAPLDLFVDVVADGEICVGLAHHTPILRRIVRKMISSRRCVVSPEAPYRISHPIHLLLRGEGRCTMEGMHFTSEAIVCKSEDMSK